MASRRRHGRPIDTLSIGRKSYGIKVNHLPQHMNEDRLNRLFQRFGSIESVSLKPGNGECYAFVNFHSNSCAHEAVNEMNGKMFEGKRINCKVQGEAVSDRRSPSVGEYTVKITSVSKSTTEAILSDCFGFGNPNCIQSVRIVPCSTGTHNYAYVNYFYQRDAERAVADLDQRWVNGSVIRVKFHTQGPDTPLHRVASYSGGSSAVPQPSSPLLAPRRNIPRAISQPAFSGFNYPGQSHPGSPRSRRGGERVSFPPARQSSDPTSTAAHPTHSPPGPPLFPPAFYASNHTDRQLPRSLPRGNHYVDGGGIAAMRQSSHPASTGGSSPHLAAGSRMPRTPSYPGVNLSSTFPPHPLTTGSGFLGQTRPSHPAMPAASGSCPQQSNTVKVSIFGVLSPEDIEEVFSRFGPIRDKPIIRGGNPYYVFVNFTTPQAAADAVSLHNSTVKNIKIYVRIHNSQKQPGINLEPREVGCTSLAASILSSQLREELASLESRHQVKVAPKQNCVKVWGPPEQVSAVELCLKSLLERVEGDISVKDFELPSHSVPVFEQDSAVEEVRRIEKDHGVEFRVLRGASDSTPVDLESFCRDVKEVFVPQDSGSSTAVPTCSELAPYLTEKPQSSSSPVDTTTTTWMWQNDDGSGYIAYTAAVSSELTRAFQDNPTGSVTVEIGSYEYLMDFSTMTQTNISSGRSRPIRQATSSDQKVQWFYMDDRREFVPYTAQQSEEIEQFYQLNAAGSVVIKGQVYKLDFTNMKQRNLATLKSRKIERRVAFSESEEQDPIPNVERILTLQAAGLPESLEPSVEDLRGIVERSTIQKQLQLNHESSKSFKAELMKNMNKYFVTAELLDECLKLKGTPRYVERVHLIAEREKLSNQEQMMQGLGGELKLPAHWKPQTQEVVLDVVKPNSEEWKTEVERIRKTLRRATIERLERVQNKWLWERYSFAKRRMLKTNKGHVNEKHLFHGTRGTEPEKVFRSEKGVDFRYSKEGGLWGTGSYFAVNASYSDAYAYSTPGGFNEKQMFICKVLTGDCYNAETNTDRSLRQPPLKPSQRTGSVLEERYDSVKGYTNGSYVYIVYDHEKVYPAYLVTYRRGPY